MCPSMECSRRVYEQTVRAINNDKRRARLARAPILSRCYTNVSSFLGGKGHRVRHSIYSCDELCLDWIMSRRERIIYGKQVWVLLLLFVNEVK